MSMRNWIIKKRRERAVDSIMHNGMLLRQAEFERNEATNSDDPMWAGFEFWDSEVRRLADKVEKAKRVLSRTPPI